MQQSVVQVDRPHGKEIEQMASLLPLVRLLGLVAAGFALGVGWKLGSHLVDVATGEKDLLWPSAREKDKPEQGEEPLWKRRFAKISDEG